jgi:hypothetical protein
MREPSAGLLLGVALSLLGCGSDHGVEPVEARILAEYLEKRPDLPAAHGDWHRSNLPGSRDYGAQFLAMHGHMAMAYDEWRADRNYEPTPAWDPAQPIPESAPHPGRATSNPASICENCVIPSWFTLEGGDAIDPHSGAQRLADFKSADQLGRSVPACMTPSAATWATTRPQRSIRHFGSFIVRSTMSSAPGWTPRASRTRLSCTTRRAFENARHDR